jgi:type I restriction enzyme M protein
MTLAELLKDSAYKLTQFSARQIQELENKIIVKQIRDKATPYIVCLVRGKEIKLTHEEIIRQLYLMVLIQDFNYPIDRIAIEYGVTFGRETKRADICIFDKDRPTVPYILVELKKPKQKDGKEQLKSYCNATGAPIGVWTNGDSISWYQRKDPNYFEDIPRLPTALEKLSDVLSARWTIDDLIKLNKLVNEKKSLKDLILEMEDEVLANAGVDVFEELFKLIFTKLYDEMEGWRDKKKHLVFRNYGDTETELKTKIQNLFDKARDKWEGVFTDDAKLQLTPSHLSVCIASLESVMLFNSNLDVVDEAFEYLINKSSKGEKGQYFTPRYVIDMCVKMLNPQEHETLIDTAAGSCGFPVHGIFHVWEAILKSEGLEKSHLFTAEAKPSRCIDYVQNKVFAIDFDEKAVRVGRTLNLIAGDGQTNVLHLNTLDYERWDEKTKDESWTDIYSEGWKKLKKLRVDKNSNRDFQFDVLMANPPFAGDIKESRILAKYELGKKDNGKYQTAVGRDYINGWDYLIDCCNLKDSNYTPKENKEYQYIELANINKSGGITDCTIAIGAELPSRARRKVKIGDVLISSIEGSLSSCAVVTKEFDKALCSTGFYIIDSSKINSETLLVLFKSELMQNILKQSCSGTILTAINKTEFSKLPIPIIDIKTQTQIANLIQQSFTLKAQSEALLTTAKRAVELAIETNEQTALDFISNSINSDVQT